MGVEVALATAAIISAGASIAGGISADRSAKREAGALNDQAALAESESLAEAKRRATEVRQFQRRQKLAFLKNGVTLEGSPLLVLDETLASGQEEVDAIMRRGSSQAKLYREHAAITRNRGRAALIGGIGQAAGTTLMAYGAGVFKGAPNPNTATDFSSKFNRAQMFARS